MNRKIPLLAAYLLIVQLANHAQSQQAPELQGSSEPEAEALVRIARFPMYEDARTTKDYDRYRETHAALLKSQFVLAAALRPDPNPDKDISQMPMVRFDDVGHMRERPVDWLRKAIQVEVLPISELMRISMALTKSPSGEELRQAEKVVNAVVAAYMSEIVNKERLDRVSMLDKLRRRYRSTSEEIEKLSNEVAILTSRSEVDDTERQRRLSRLDRLSSQQIDLELKAIQVNDDDGQRKVIEAQLIHVRDAYDKELAGLRELVDPPGELTARYAEIDSLREELRAVRAETGKMEFRLAAPERIQIIQSATFSSPIRAD